MRKIRVFYQKYSYLYHSLLCPLSRFDIFIFFSSFLQYTHFYLNHSLEIHIYIESLPLETFIGSREKSPFSYTKKFGWAGLFFLFRKFLEYFDIVEMHFQVDSTHTLKCELFDQTISYVHFGYIILCTFIAL